MKKNKSSRQSLNGHVRVDEMSKNVCAMSIEGASWKNTIMGKFVKNALFAAHDVIYFQETIPCA